MDYKQMVESCGAVFVGIQEGGREPLVLFQAAHNMSTRALYRSACNPDNIELALKGDREQIELEAQLASK
jgi:hypothetical protein